MAKYTRFITLQQPIFKQINVLVCFLRVTTISDRLEREEEACSDATVKRLARLEEQVVTWFFLITNVVPIMLRQRGTMQKTDVTLLGAPMCLLNFISRRAQRKFGYLLMLHKQSLKVFDSLLCCLIRLSSQPKPCSGLWTVWNLRVLQQKKHNHWVSNTTSSPITTVNLHIFVIVLQIYLSPSCARSVLFFPAALTTTDADTYVSTSEKEDRFHVNARQFHYPSSKITRFPVPEEKVPWEVFHVHLQHKVTSCWNSEHQCIKKVWFYHIRRVSCPLLSGQLQLIHANLLHVWRRWGPCGWVRFYQGHSVLVPNLKVHFK